MMMEKLPVLAVVGPTASGKTALGVGLARRYNGEIVSADSMQIYKGMDIATAKPTAAERQGVPHHLIDFLPVEQTYSAAAFVRDAENAVREIRAAGRLPILVGGTGLYVDAFLGPLTFEEEPEGEAVRRRLREELEASGLSAMAARLFAADPALRGAVDEHNEKRVLRALEILELTGEKPSERRKRALLEKPAHASVYLGISFRDREQLYRRIEQRVDEMFSAGLAAEARRYYELDQENTAAQAIGYKELAGYLRGEETLAEAREKLIRATRRYAKRQLTWFRRNPDVHWIFRDGMSNDDVLEQAETILDGLGYEKGEVRS